MSRYTAAPRPAHRSFKETSEMLSRFAVLVLSAALAALALAAAIPAAASATSPWWQVLDGSRPSNLWEPTDSVQEINATMENAEVAPGFFLEGVAQNIEIAGKHIGCLGSQNELGIVGCEFFIGGPVVTDAASLKAVLEPVYGPEVEVTGGPVAVNPLIVTVPGRSVPVIGGFMTRQEGKEQDPEQIAFGNATNKVLSEGGSGRLVVTVTNLGDEEVDGAAKPVTIVDKLPEGAIATGDEAFAGRENRNGPVECEVESGGKEVICTFKNELPSYESIEIEIPVALESAATQGEPPVAGTPGEITVSGGGAPPASGEQRINVSPDEVQFGVERFSAVAEEEGGAEATGAGIHPFQFTTTIQMNAGPMLPAGKRRDSAVVQPGQPRNFKFTLPIGVVGNVTAVPRCSTVDFYDNRSLLGNECPDEAAVGVVATTIVEKTNLGFTRLAVPLFNLDPAFGEPARLGFTAGGASVVIDFEVDPNDKYRIIGRVKNATQLAEILSSTVTVWGSPGDSRHDSSRGSACAFRSDTDLCLNPPAANENAFLRLPVNCTEALQSGVEVEPWNVPLRSVVASESFTTPPLKDCAQVPFKPSIEAAPTNKKANGSSGLDFTLNMPNAGLLSKDAIAEGQAKKVEVTLPEGVTINPSQAGGLSACSPTQFAQETASSPPGAGCPEAAKVGSVQVKTPILEEELNGSVYVATPYDNPFNSLVALYVVVKSPVRGVIVKQAGKVELNPNTGQIVSTFDDLPQLPFETFNLHFNSGSRAPLVMPSQCGTYQVTARFTPWSAEDPNNPTPSELVTKTSSFSVDQGCPSGPPAFNPDFVAGTANNAAGSYSPFNIRLTRTDEEQEFSRFSVKLPKGVIGNLSGIPFCSDAAITAAAARVGPNGGQEELDSPSCPSASQIGRTLVGAGVGPDLTYVPGKVYLAGPYKGAKLSIVAITTGKAGPFDLGTVVIRQALRIDPETAEVTSDGTSSDPIPHILKGVVVHARDIRVYIDRDKFVLNPTSCEKMTAAATVLSGGGASANVSSPFQAADCASLGFKPKLSMQLLGGTTRTATPRLKAVLTARKGDANIGRAQVTLPPSEFLEQNHIRTVCTRVQFNAGAGNGEQCPKAAIYGKAKAISPLLDEPISGPVFLRSSNHELPDLVAALHSSKVDINLVGRIDSTKQGGIRSTFEEVPDAPVSKFILQMQGGKKGLFVNSEDICKAKHRAKAAFTGQNGKLHEFNPVVKTKCGGKKDGKGKK
jgi:hypothetical protein